MSKNETDTTADKLWTEIVEWAHKPDYPDDRLRMKIEEALKKAHEAGQEFCNAKR